MTYQRAKVFSSKKSLPKLTNSNFKKLLLFMKKCANNIDSICIDSTNISIIQEIVGNDN